MTRASTWTPEQDAQLCDLIADGKTFEQAAAVMGLNYTQAFNRFEAIRSKMGWQAV